MLVDRRASQLLGRPMTIFLVLVCFLQLLTWLPHYLTWPLWADHDVFATIARGWDAGRLPYRDLYCNQFPGAIYLFYILGRITGWGGSAAIYAFDAGAILLLGGGLALWSRRVFGRTLPGLVGYLSFLSFYLGLDYTQAAQRDWHAPLLAVLGLLTLQVSAGGTSAPALSGAAVSLAISVRPHAILFLPAVAIQFFSEIRSGAGRRRPAVWALSFALTTVAWILPLAASGVLPDLVARVGRGNAPDDGRGLRAAALAVNLLRQFDGFGLIAVGAAVAVLLRADRGRAMVAAVWLGALAFALLYDPISPRGHSYLRIPLRLVFAVNVAVLTDLILRSRRAAPSFQLLAFLLILGMSCRLRPESCTLRPSLKAVAAAARGVWPVGTPPGYRRRGLDVAGYYNWDDYRATLDYLRPVASHGTRIANALRNDPAIVGCVGGLSAFPAESLAWLRMVNREDEPRFAAALEGESDSVVVWSPGERGPDPSLRIDRIESAIRHLYQPEARFGVIEVWRRKVVAVPAASLATRSGVEG